MKHILSVTALIMLLFLGACDDKLDIKPLGKTTLDKVDDLESLLNQIPYLYNGEDVLDLELICNNTYWAWYGLPEKMSNKQSMEYALLTYDSSIDRANLEETNSRYNKLYSNINYCNVVISKMPDAEGDSSKKDRLIAEARILRAWYHFLLVNIYAKQYDAASAAELGGIPYVDNTNVQDEKTKLSLEETYSRILDDCSDNVIADLNPNNVADPCRFGADFGFGVRARVLYQMKRYDEALTYANKALAINGKIEDRTYLPTAWKWTLTEFADNNYYIIYANNSNLGDFYGFVASPDLASLIDPNDFVNAYHFDSGAFGWDTPYPSTPKGSLQCTVADIRWNVYGLRAESMYYLAAECMIRNNNVQGGLTLIDKVREKRIDLVDKYASLNLSKEEAMKIFQDNKRVEFMNTFENFFDRKRWNSEADYKTNIVRDLSNVDGTDYGVFTLTPESPIWVRPFPQAAVNYNSSLTQNY